MSSQNSADVRRSLSHPVVDADGHYIETMPILKPFLIESVREIAGGDLAKRIEAGAAGVDYDETVLRPWSVLSERERRERGISRPPWWTLPAANTLDRATAHLPGLMAARLDDMGIDYAVMYPSRMLTATAIGDAELRVAVCRSLNRFFAEAYRPYADRMTPVAQIPTHTPEEAIAELEYAVQELGFKAVLINGLVHRPLAAGATTGARPNWGSISGSRMDVLGLDSEYDYDPFWKRCVELKVAPATHTPGMGWGSRQSPSNYMYNHIGSFGAAMEATCKGLFMGGVTQRFPQLSFGMLEGGVGWACTLLSDLIEHWEKRNSKTIHNLDPKRINADQMMQLFAQYGDKVFKADAPGLRDSFANLEPEPPVLDEWSTLKLSSERDLVDAFVPHFYFGCEADDLSIAWAFNDKFNPEVNALGAEVFSTVVDVRRRDQLDAFAAKTFEVFGSVALVFVNAGVMRAATSWLQPAADWELVVDINLKGAGHTAAAFMPRLLEQNQPARLVFTGSTSAFLPRPQLSAYSCTKHALWGLAEAMQLELHAAGTPVGVSLLAPAGVRTALADAPSAAPGGEMQAMVRSMIEAYGMPPEELAQLTFVAVREQKFWILPHPEFKAQLQDRVARVAAETDPAA